MFEGLGVLELESLRFRDARFGLFGFESIRVGEFWVIQGSI